MHGATSARLFIAPGVTRKPSPWSMMSTRDPSAYDGALSNWLRFGASPRAAQSIVLAAKVHALVEGRINVAFRDVRYGALPSLRRNVAEHREAWATQLDVDEPGPLQERQLRQLKLLERIAKASHGTGPRAALGLRRFPGSCRDPGGRAGSRR